MIGLRIVSLLAALLLIGSRAAVGQAPGLTTSGTPALLRISTAVPGAQPASVSSATTTYRIRVNNASTKKVTVQLDAPMPARVTLTVMLAAPAGATSLGAVSLDAIARDAVVSITGVNSSHGITYQLTATVDAGVVPLSSRTVTLTLVDYP